MKSPCTTRSTPKNNFATIRPFPEKAHRPAALAVTQNDQGFPSPSKALGLGGRNGVFAVAVLGVLGCGTAHETSDLDLPAADDSVASTGSPLTTGAVCVKAKVNTVNGWNASNVQGRTATAQGATVQGPIVPTQGSIPNQPGLSAGSDGFVYFNFTAGQASYASMACW